MLAPTIAARLSDPTEDQRALVQRFEARRLAVLSDQQSFQLRCEEVMRWVNPPWDTIGRRIDPRAELATAERKGENIIHVDMTNPAVDRWASLQVGVAPVFRVRPAYVSPPVTYPDDPEATTTERKLYDLDRQIAQAEANAIENQTTEWVESNDFHRTLLWAAWSKEAFGKAILRSGYDAEEDLPTVELMENPAQVYYGWSQRYGRRRLSWAMVIEEIGPEEALLRFGIALPMDTEGRVDLAAWAGFTSDSELDPRPETSDEQSRYVRVSDAWELAPNPDADNKVQARHAFILAGRVIEGPTFYPWAKLPFHVLENQHIPTWSHGKSTAEVMVPINEALDDTWDRQHQVIKFESGPRYKGMGMANASGDVDIPPPFHMVPLREGTDIAQIDTRVDFWPAQVHVEQMFEATYRATGLTPIAWGMSPNAQTSGRAMSAEWRAVELPLHGRLINLTPVVKEILGCWWDYAEAYSLSYKDVGKGIRRFDILWAPFDIRDKTEKTLDIIQRYQADLLDPETAIQETGYENTDEIIARIRAYLLDPVWNPLRYQQYLTLRQLELTIRQTELQVAAMEQEAQGGAATPGGAPGQPTPEELAAQGANAAGAGAQGPGGPVTTAQNQPGMAPGGLPIETSILSQTPLEGGIGNRAIVPLGPTPAAGQAPR